MATTRPSRAAIATCGAALAVLTFGVLELRCGGGDQAAPILDAAPIDDASIETLPETYASDDDVESTSDVRTKLDCGGSSWPGWRRISLPDSACCELGAAESVSSVLHPLTWHPCSDAPDCSELDGVALGVSGPTPSLFFAGSSRGSDGKPMWLELDYTVGSSGVSQFAIYDWARSSPVAAWRSYGTSLRCSVGPLLGSRKVALLEILHPEYDKWLAVGDPVSLSVGPVFQSVSGGEVPAIQDVALSDTTFAFDLPLAGRILRTAIGSGKYVLSPPTGFPRFLADFAEKDDVFVLSVHGTAGYGQEWRIDPDGTPVVVRAKDGRHISTVATDGAKLVWLEIYGSTDFFATMTREVWAAPYSTDAATIDATAKKVAAIADGHVTPAAIAYGGIYAVKSVANGREVFVVRLADGAVKTVSEASGFENLVFVSDAELWATTGAGALRRYSLGTW